MEISPLYHNTRPEGELLPQEEAAFSLLEELGMDYDRVTSEPADTMEKCAAVSEVLGMPICKNLFLCNRQKTQFYLLCMGPEKPFHTKDLSHQIGSARLSFAPEESLWELLRCTPGSATILGLMNDNGHQVRLLMEQGVDRAHIVRRAAQALFLSEETLSDRWGELEEESKAAMELPPAAIVSGGQMKEMLLRFLNLPLISKSNLYFNCRLARVPAQSDTALVLLELFRALYHLNNYGDKLLVNQQLDEDHCTQLLREIFNLNGSEWWKLSANDQQQSGSTGKVAKNGLNISAENDLLIKSENYT